MKTRVWSAAFFFLLLPSIGLMAVEPPAKPKTVKLFTIGNSFSQNATRYLADVTKAGGNVLIQKGAVIGGSSMEVHCGKIDANEKDPTSAAGHYTGGKGLKELLASDKWDFITIQQASIKSHDLQTYQPFATKLRDYVKKHAPGAELLVHQTWAYRVDDPRFSPNASAEPRTQKAMYDGLTNAYTTIAKELGIRRIPTGDAFYMVDTDPKWGYRPDKQFDSKTAKSPALPVQSHSLHVGYRRANDKLGMDGHHANVAGEYLGACVWYEILFDTSVVGNTFVPKGVDADFAKFLQETAHKAVEKSREQKLDSNN